MTLHLRHLLSDVLVIRDERHQSLTKTERDRTESDRSAVNARIALVKVVVLEEAPDEDVCEVEHQATGVEAATTFSPFMYATH